MPILIFEWVVAISYVSWWKPRNFLDAQKLFSGKEKKSSKWPSYFSRNFLLIIWVDFFFNCQNSFIIIDASSLSPLFLYFSYFLTCSYIITPVKKIISSIFSTHHAYLLMMCGASPLLCLVRTVNKNPKNIFFLEPLWHYFPFPAS